MFYQPLVCTPRQLADRQAQREADQRVELALTIADETPEAYRYRVAWALGVLADAYRKAVS